jgi:hypothetical protein
MHLVEPTDHCSPAEQASSGARADGINSIEEWSPEVEDPSKNPGTRCGQVAEEDEDAGEGPDEDEPEEDVKEELTICPTRVLARLDPPLFRDRGDHSVKLAPRSLEVGPEPRPSCVSFESHFPIQEAAVQLNETPAESLGHLTAREISCPPT